MKLFIFILCAAYGGISVCQAVCDQVFASGLSAQEQQTVVNKHNALRLDIANQRVNGQPRGINLKRMVYDAQLATAAQNIADTCVFAHVPVTDGRWFAVGQNLYATYSSDSAGGSDWNGAVQGWFDEYKKYTYPGGFSLATGHYTQVVWADTTNVGCGYTFYKKNNDQYPYQKIYVCNYGPAGNVNNQPPYKTGTSGCENLC